MRHKEMNLFGSKELPSLVNTRWRFQRRGFVVNYFRDKLKPCRRLCRPMASDATGIAAGGQV
jgi:hypothetical protein